MLKTCAVCKKGKGSQICKVCGFLDNVSIDRRSLSPEDIKKQIEKEQFLKIIFPKDGKKHKIPTPKQYIKNWMENVVKPYRKKWKEKTREAKLWAKEIEKKYGTFTDPRDGKKYKTIEINGQVWMAENLAYSIGGRYYKDKPAYGKKYHLLYNWNAAMEACPPGWHLPSNEEWKSLMNFIGNRWQGQKLMAKVGWANCKGTDEFGFAAMPGGYGLSNLPGDFGDKYYVFSKDYECGYWWTSTEYSSGKAYCWYIHNYGNCDKKHYYKSSMLSVRCVKNSAKT